MARKKKHEEHENHERWLVSYADFITLLFAFFVVMYSISSVNEGKYRVLSNSLVAAFRASPRSPTPIQIGKPLTTPTQPQSNLDRRLKLVHTFDLPLPIHDRGPKTGLGNTREHNVRQSHADKTGQPGGRRHGGAAGGDQPGSAGQLAVKEISARVETAMAGLISKHLIKVRSDKSWVQVEINTSILFPSGSATLSAAARPVLEKLATILKPFPNPIHVEGFTDNVPINTVEFPSNWELSAGRAATVVHLFTDAGVQPQRMAAVGYGQYHPAASNATAEGRSKNRRVVLVVYAGKDSQSVGVPGDPTVVDQTLKGGAAGGADAAPTTAGGDGSKAVSSSPSAGPAKSAGAPKAASPSEASVP
jgi:chemotaxis protein MotB